MQALNGFSLKLKFAFVLITLSTLVLCTYGYVALTDFEHDKISYVFDAAKGHVESTASQLRSDRDFILEKVKLYTRGFHDGKFHAYMPGVFVGDQYISALTAYQVTSEDQFTKTDELKQANASVKISDELLKNALRDGLAIEIDPGGSESWWLAQRSTPSPGGLPQIFVAQVVKGSFAKAFSSDSPFDTFLTNQTGAIIIQPPRWKHLKSESQQKWMAEHIHEKNPQGTVTFEATPKGETEALLVSSSHIPQTNYYVVSVLAKSAALQAQRLLMYKSISFLISLVFLTFMVSIITSGRLTRSLKMLLHATRRIAKGDFNVEVSIRNRDEMGQLASGFEIMAKEIQRLIGETVEKTRMENELKTAQLVQSTLFPEMQFQHGNVEIKGFYTPASECGGDWFHYFNLHDKIYTFIGDATGHGVPAALVTSAVHSAVKVLEQFPEMPLEKVMEILNNAIHATANGEVNMTFFIGQFNPMSGEFKYCNASHDPPFRLPAEHKPVKRQGLEPLLGQLGKRLGQEPNSRYESSSVHLNPGDRLVFYTDGITELVNDQGQLWGERNFVRVLLKAFNENLDPSQSIDFIQTEMNEFRKNTQFNDDVTYFVMDIKPQPDLALSAG